MDSPPETSSEAVIGPKCMPTMPAASDGSLSDARPCPRRRRRRRPLIPLLLIVAAIGVFTLRLPAVGAGPGGRFEGWAAAAWPTASSPAELDGGSGQKGVVGRQFNPFPFPPARRRGVVECLQVAQPVLMPKVDNDGDSAGRDPKASRSCSVVLMDHVFARSYGQPFVGNYSPPDCDFNRVAMNFTVVSEGRQFDRLAIMYLNDTEVWRTSTAEPVAPPGIRWEYHKDMTPYLAFWKTPQTVIFDLGNLIDDTYNGTFNATLTATFFRDDARTAAAAPADLIIPITGRRGSQVVNPASVFVVPEQDARATVAAFPRNANRAVLSVSACGQAAEEFWWSNFLDSDVAAFNDTVGMAYGYSPFREVQALIDGNLAGVTWPFPVVFTGGVVPSLHRPVVGLQAFDMREHEIDITPWLPLLCDGNPHSISFVVSGLHDDGGTKAGLTDKVNSNWPVTGKIFVWLDEPGSVTTGTAPKVQGLDPSIAISHRLFQDTQGANRSLAFSVDVQRDFTVSSTVVTKHQTTTSTWRQRLSFVIQSNVTRYGETQIVDFNVTGSDTASSNKTSIYGHDYHYPLGVNMQTSTDSAGALSLSARLDQGLVLQTSGAAVYPDGLEAFSTAAHGIYAASVLSTSRRGVATFRQSADKRSTSASGRTAQAFSFGGNFQRYPDLTSPGGGVGPQPDVMLYFRNISTNDNDIVRDRVSVSDSALGDAVVAPFEGVSNRDGEGNGENEDSPFGPAGEQVIMTPPAAVGRKKGQPDGAPAASGVGAQGQVSGGFAIARFGPFAGRGGLR
ncbi:hypothetical protein RB595_002769 [Gaeumannomyces hyphopodioides]